MTKIYELKRFILYNFFPRLDYDKIYNHLLINHKLLDEFKQNALIAFELLSEGGLAEDLFVCLQFVHGNLLEL